MLDFIAPNGTRYSALAELNETRSVNGERSLTGIVVEGDTVIDNLDRGWKTEFNDEIYVFTYAMPIDKGVRTELQVDAVHEFFYDFEKSVVYEQLLDGSHKMVDYLDFIFNNSGYSYNLEVSVSAFEKQSFGMKNRLTLFYDIINSTGAEFVVTGKIVRILAKVGTDLTTIVKKGFNLNDLKVEKNISGFITYMRGYGAFSNPDDKNSSRLMVEYSSPLVSIYGKLEGDPIVDERYTIKDNLLTRVKNTVDNSYTWSVQLEFEDLTLAGYKYDQPQEGDYITVINDDIGFKERVRIVSFTSEYDVEGNLLSHKVTCNDIGIVQQQANKQAAFNKKVDEAFLNSLESLDIANKAQISADGKSMVFYGPFTPTATKKGDIWFKTEGEETTMYIWNGTEWIQDVSTKDNKELKELFDKLQKEVDANTEATKNVAGDVADAKKNAEDALSKAEYSESVVKESNERIENLDNKFNGLVYENRNYLIGTKPEKIVNMSTPDNKNAPIVGYAIVGQTILSNSSRALTGVQTMFTTPPQTLESGFTNWSTLKQMKLSAGDDMTFTYAFSVSGDTYNKNNAIVGYAIVGQTIVGTGARKTPASLSGTYELYLADSDNNLLSKIASGTIGDTPKTSVTFKLTNADLSAVKIVIKASNKDAIFIVPEETCKLELGTHATRWIEAFEELDIVTTDLKTDIIQTDAQIKLQAERVDLVSGQVVNMNAEIKLQADQIQLKVSKDGVISAINQTAETITIDAKRIDLWGDVVLKSWRYPGQTSINGGMIQTETIIADKVIGGTGWFDKVFVAGITVGTAQIGDSVITTAKIGDLQVTSAKIKDIVADKITTGTLNAANVSIINLDVNSLTGNRSAFVQTAWNGIDGNVFIDSTGLYAKNASGGKNVSLSSSGLTIMSGDASGKIGVRFDYMSMNLYDVNQRQIGRIGSLGSTVVQVAALSAAGNLNIGFATDSNVTSVGAGLFMTPTQTTLTNNLKINAGQFLFCNSWGSSDGSAISRISKVSIDAGGGLMMDFSFIGSDNLQNGIAFNSARCYIIAGGKAIRQGA